MLSSARQSSAQSQPSKKASFGNQQVDNGANAFANRMAAARQRAANNRGGSAPMTVGRKGQQLRSPASLQQQRAEQAILRKASARNRRLAQEMLGSKPNGRSALSNKPTAARIMAQKLKKVINNFQW